MSTPEGCREFERTQSQRSWGGSAGTGSGSATQTEPHSARQERRVKILLCKRAFAAVRPAACIGAAKPLSRHVDSADIVGYLADMPATPAASSYFLGVSMVAR
jgi:hypothetical protein